ncbi:RimJ/RimL family protein N-acetyltransferase [Arthrobacter ginsengisoli]|uniref:RimJ/RimL family protein N-acetyltransferase n=1 Tax=Arthrobacter ginsengisoli TaxID=1356565 RepID=A0ABU1UFD8_9MICC|nr:GNAT family N-acetyltransferase [Arthrobacter ginsengisoli]MDR7083846.1 RimJ/RimL family protein N-acetyltransferase [Arthrobacter ginsengisoli]
MPTFLETERLLLRQFTPDDAGLVELDSDPRVMRYITGGIPTSRGEIEDDFLPAFLAYYQRFPGYGFWAALERTTGDFLGWFHFRPGPEDPQDQPERGLRRRLAGVGSGQ